ncbi:MAG: hypothetical protein QXG10_01930 [Candidatus Hadarchaeales archaeon]
MTDSSKGMMVVGGIGCIIWLAGGITCMFIASVGDIILGIGILIASFGVIGLWQRTKESIAMFSFLMKLIGGIFIMIAGILILANIGVSGTIASIGQFILGIGLIFLGLVMNKHGSGLGVRNILGQDLVFPAVIASIASGCAVMGAAVAVTIPVAVVFSAIFLLAK